MKKVEGDSGARVVCSIILGLYTFRVSVRHIREMFSDNRRRRASKESTRLCLKKTIGTEAEAGSPRVKEEKGDMTRRKLPGRLSEFAVFGCRRMQRANSKYSEVRFTVYWQLLTKLSSP